MPLFFLLVFTAYTVLLALSLFRSRNFVKQIDQLQHDVKRNEVCCYDSGKRDARHGTAANPLVAQGVDFAKAQELLGNPLVQQAMQQSDDEQVQELQTLLSNPLVQQAMGNK